MNTQSSYRNASVGIGCLLVGILGGASLVGCASVEDPQIVNVDVEPETWSISGITDTATFTVIADVIHFSGDVSQVTARVEDSDLSFSLRKSDDILNGERWETSTELTLWSGVSTGTYYISITATDVDGDTVTRNRAAQVIITD